MDDGDMLDCLHQIDGDLGVPGLDRHMVTQVSALAVLALEQHGLDVKPVVTENGLMLKDARGLFSVDLSDLLQRAAATKSHQELVKLVGDWANSMAQTNTAVALS